MKEVNITQVDFSEIFEFAEKKHGIYWNLCNDLFFGTEIIKYKSYTECWLDELEADLEEAKEDPKLEKAYKILCDFMKQNDLKKMMILSD